MARDYRHDDYDEDYDEDYDDYDDRPRRRRRRADVEPHRGTMILVLGILGIAMCPFLGPFAWMMGKGDLEKINAGEMDPEGQGTTKAGYICGIVATILLIIQLLLYAFLFIIIIGAEAGR